MTKAYSIFLTVLFTVFIGGVLVISALLPKEEFSEMENRFLQKPPELSIETVKNGKFMENAEKYVSDHIAGRDLWVAAKAWGERLSGKQENNGVYFAAQDTLINRVEEPDGETWEQLDQNLEYLDQLVSNAGVPVYFGLIPSAAQVWHDRLPDGAPTADEAAIIETLYSRTAARTVDLLSVLLRPQRGGALLPHRPPLDQPGRLLRLHRPDGGHGDGAGGSGGLCRGRL